MKTILILGSTSPIGAALSEQFSRGNKVILSGRNQTRLNETADRCMKFGAIAVKIAATDLAKSIQVILDINSEWPIEMIIDAASATSMHRDSEVTSEAILDILQADLISHLHIYRKLSQLNNKHPDIVFISTVLAIVKTPDREIYSALKRLIEIYLQKIMASEPLIRVLIFRIGTLIDSRKDSLKAIALAERVRHDLLVGHTTVKYGFSGKILVCLNTLHPVVLNFFVKAQRTLRGK